VVSVRGDVVHAVVSAEGPRFMVHRQAKGQFLEIQDSQEVRATVVSHSTIT